MGAERSPVETGEKYGYLTLLRELPDLKEKKNTVRMVEVMCVCGKVKSVRLNTIRCGLARSCGCKKYELRFENPFEKKAIKMAYDFLLLSEKKDRLEQIKQLEYLAMYGNLTLKTHEETVAQMFLITNEILK